MNDLLFTIAGLFDFILSNIYTIIPNFGITIIVLSILVKIATYPLNNQQIKSARRMQELQPEIKRIQNKYKHDKQKQNEELTRFMQENKFNPLSGCLPLLVQMPFLIGIFRLLSDVEEFNIIHIPGFNKYLFTFLEGTAVEWGNLLVPDPFYILPVVAGITTYMYSKLSMTDPSQKMFLYMMPGMIFVFSISFPAGLVLYWITNNILTIFQHKFVTGKDMHKKDSKNEKLSDDEFNDEEILEKYNIKGILENIKRKENEKEQNEGTIKEKNTVEKKKEDQIEKNRDKEDNQEDDKKDDKERKNSPEKRNHKGEGVNRDKRKRKKKKSNKRKKKGGSK